jgi:hypothetical protein
MTVLRILRDLIDYTCISWADRDPTSAALRQTSVGIRLCFIHESDVGRIRLLHQEWVQVQGMAAAPLCVKKSGRTLADGRNCEKYWGKNVGGLSSSRRRMPEIKSSVDSR